MRKIKGIKNAQWKVTVSRSGRNAKQKSKRIITSGVCNRSIYESIQYTLFNLPAAAFLISFRFTIRNRRFFVLLLLTFCKSECKYIGEEIVLLFALFFTFMFLPLVILPLVSDLSLKNIAHTAHFFHLQSLLIFRTLFNITIAILFIECGLWKKCLMCLRWIAIERNFWCRISVFNYMKFICSFEWWKKNGGSRRSGIQRDRIIFALKNQESITSEEKSFAWVILPANSFPTIFSWFHYSRPPTKSHRAIAFRLCTHSYCCNPSCNHVLATISSQQQKPLHYTKLLSFRSKFLKEKTGPRSMNYI